MTASEVDVTDESFGARYEPATVLAAPWPGCAPGCVCAGRYGQRPMRAPAGRLVMSVVALRPGDRYLVDRPGRIAEALITALWMPAGGFANPACNRAGIRTVDGQEGKFWVNPGYVVVTSRDPAYEGWNSDFGDSPAPHAPADALAFSPRRFASAFRYGGGCVTGIRGTRDGRPDWAALHAETRYETAAGWDNFGRGRPEDGQQPYFGCLVVARTACLAEDLGQNDDVRPPGPLDSFIPRYKCRRGHIHRGESPYGRELPPEVAARISASLGEEPSGGALARRAAWPDRGPHAADRVPQP